MTSPLRAVAASLLLGTIVGLLGGAGLAAGLASLGLLAALAARKRPRLAWTLLAASAAALVGALRGGEEGGVAPPVVATEVTEVVGDVVRAADFDAGDEPGERTASFRVRVEDAGLWEVRLRLRMDDVPPALLPGDRVRLVGSCAPIRRPTNPGESDRRAELAREGVRGELRVGAAEALVPLGAGPMDVATRVRRAGEIARRALIARIDAACGSDSAEGCRPKAEGEASNWPFLQPSAYGLQPARRPPAAALLSCLLLGDRSGIDDATNDAFRDSGTAHLLSVSGLHVVLLAQAARALARRLVSRRARRRFGPTSLVLLLVVYCALCRFATPVVRAAVFLAAAETARALGRRPSPLDALAAAAALVVAVDPAQVLDPSFQLSFVAVLGLALFTRGFRQALFPSLALYRKFPESMSRRRLRFYERLSTAVAASLAASGSTAPVVAAVFGRLQPSAPLANLAAVPLAAFLVPLAAALALVGGLASWLTAPLAAVAVWPLQIAVRAASRLPCASIATGRPPWPALAATAAALVVAAWLVRRRPRAGLALSCATWLVLAATPLWRATPAGPEIVVLDVGHGLCVLARTGADGDVLFDAGGHVPGVGRRCIVPALREMGVRRLAAVFLSHQDADHCGALFDVLDAVPVGEVVVSPGFGADPLPRALVARCRADGVPVTVVARGDAWTRHGVAVRVLSPCGGAPDGPDNERSIVAHVTLGDGLEVLAAVVPGDVEGAPLHALVHDPTAPAARVLVLPHHGRGDPAEQLALARRLAADVLVASTSATAPMSVPGAFVTGIDGAIRVRPGAAPEAFPWR